MEKSTVRKTSITVILTVIALVLLAIVLSLYFNRARSLGEQLGVDLESPANCTLQFRFDVYHEYTLDEEQIGRLMERIIDIPARYTGPDSGKFQAEPDCFSLFLSSWDYVIDIAFYEDGTVISGDGRSYARYAIDQTDYEDVRQLVEGFAAEETA